jgi:arylsulfatase A-like enzyme
MTKTTDIETSQNVLYITIDAIRADRVGFPTGEPDTTPVLNEIAREGIAFERAVANGVPTYYSFKSLLGGIHSLSHSRAIGLPSTAPSIAEVFEEAGYATAGFNAKNPWLTPSYGYDRGFQTYRDFMRSKDSGIALGQVTRRVKRIAKRTVAFSDLLTDKLGRYARIANAMVESQPLEPAEPITETAIEWLNSLDGDRPFFLWIHYMDPHYPWTPPTQYLGESARSEFSRFDIGSIWHTVAHEYQKERTTIDEKKIARIKDLYDAEIRRTDAAIGRLLDAIRSDGEFGETIVAVAGDHGTELADHGGFSHGPRTLYDELLRVPLMFHGPGVPSDTKETAALVDVPRTLVELVDGVTPPRTFEGIDLLCDDRTVVTSEVVYDVDPARDWNSENGLLQAQTNPPWKLIRNQHTGTTELYHVGNDPSEQNPVTDAKQVRSDLEAALDQHRETVERRNRTIKEKKRVKHRIAELKAAEKI